MRAEYQNNITSWSVPMISFILTAKRLLQALFISFKEKVFLSLLSTLLLINLSGVLFYSSVEGWSYLDAFYFAWVSLIPTGVDIGLAPVTTVGKIFTMMYLVVGMGVMIGLLAVIAKAVLNFEEEEHGEDRKKKLQQLRDRAKNKGKA